MSLRAKYWLPMESSKHYKTWKVLINSSLREKYSNHLHIDFYTWIKTHTNALAYYAVTKAAIWSDLFPQVLFLMQAM